MISYVSGIILVFLVYAFALPYFFVVYWCFISCLFIIWLDWFSSPSLEFFLFLFEMKTIYITSCSISLKILIWRAPNLVDESPFKPAPVLCWHEYFLVFWSHRSQAHLVFSLPQKWNLTFWNLDLCNRYIHF